MAKKKAVVETVPETKPTHLVPVEIRGETYELCFNVLDLSKAERHFCDQGHSVNLMFSLPEMTLSAIRTASRAW